MARSHARNLAEARLSTIYVDNYRTPVDADEAQALLLHRFTHGVVDALASTLVSGFSDTVVPVKRGPGLSKHHFGGHPIVRPRIVATTPSATGRGDHARRHYGYYTDAFDDHARWNSVAEVAFGLRGPTTELRRALVTDPSLKAELFERDGEVSHIVDSYVRPAIRGDGYAERGKRFVSSYRLAEAITVIGGQIIARECKLLEISGPQIPTLELSGLELEAGPSGLITARPCQPGL